MGKKLHKKAKVEYVSNDLKKKKLQRFTASGKPSLDVKFSEELTPEEFSNYIAEHGEKQGEKIVFGGNNQLINGYKKKIANILDYMGYPSDIEARYLENGDIAKEHEEGYFLGGYLGLPKFKDIPNIHRIGWILCRFKHIKQDIDDGNLESALNLTLRLIEEYNSMVIIGIENKIVDHTQVAAIQERVKSGQETKTVVFELADKLHLENTSRNKTRLSELISAQTKLSADYIRTRYLTKWKPPIK